MGLTAAKERQSARVESWESNADWYVDVQGLAWTWKRNGKVVDRESVPFGTQRILLARLHPDRDCSVCRSVHGSETIHPCE